MYVGGWMDAGSYLDLSNGRASEKAASWCSNTILESALFRQCLVIILCGLSLSSTSMSKNAFSSLSFADWFINFCLALGAICLLF